MYLVSFTNFGYSKQFNDLDAAVTHMRRSGFEAVLMTPKGEVIAKFRPISGLSYVVFENNA
jgi:hypothetical protein